MKKSEIMAARPVAYYSGFGGIEIKSINYDIDDYVIYIAGAWCSEKSVHKSKIYYTMSGSPYFKYKGTRVHLDECIRC